MAKGPDLPSPRVYSQLMHISEVVLKRHGYVCLSAGAPVSSVWALGRAAQVLVPELRARGRAAGRLVTAWGMASLALRRLPHCQPLNFLHYA